MSDMMTDIGHLVNVVVTVGLSHCIWIDSLALHLQEKSSIHQS